MKRLLIMLCAVLVPLASVQGKGTKIIFMGDSITDGNWGGGGNPDNRNRTDYNHIYGHGFMEMIAAHYMSVFPEEEYVFRNCGISGYTLNNLKDRWEKDVVGERPDVLSVLVGTNDAGSYTRTYDTEEQFEYGKWDSLYRSLLDKAIEANPSVRIVLCSPFVDQTGVSPNWELRRVIVAKLSAIVKKIASDYKAQYVPFDVMFAGLGKKYRVADKYWIWDGVHPTTAGHERMSKLWIRTVGKL